MSLPTQSNDGLYKINKRRQQIHETVVFAMLGTLMFCSKIIMEALPNIHLLGMLIVALTLVYRVKALIPIYIYVFLNGIFSGFSVWWIPYLYIWTVLWGIAMLIPRKLPKITIMIIASVVCSLHGFLFGVLYAPAWAIIYGMDFNQMLLWISAGAYFDVIHGISNFLVGLLIFPISRLILKLEQQYLK